MKRGSIYLVLMLLVSFETILVTQAIMTSPYDEIDVALLNDLHHQLAETQVDYANVQASSVYTICVIDQDDTMLFAGDNTCATTIHEAWMKRDTVMTFEDKTIFVNTNTEKQVDLQKQRAVYLYGCILLQLFGCILLIEWVQKRFFKPFKNLQDFAWHISEGNLDYPLEMDRYQSFGVFSESFDMMRDALKHAKAQEAAANKSKKELVAKLSHDIKTPVATIKAVSEVMQMKTAHPKEQEQLHIISIKADQIDALISNLFHATLEELEQLQVQNVLQPTSIILTMLKQADYLHHVQIMKWEDALVYYDALRLSQVIDNLISNAYKYANSDIDIMGICKDDAYILTMQDHGGGIDMQDIAYVQNKFYRGKNTKNQSGSGLGLYISTYFMCAMQGDMTIENKDDGLCITLVLPFHNIS